MPDNINIDYNSLFSLVMQAPVSFMLLHGDNLLIKLVNQRATEYIGRPAEDLINRPFFEAFSELEGGIYENIIQNILATGETFNAREIPLHLINWDSGENRYLNLILKPLFTGEKITGIMGVASDVTELVRSRNDFRESKERLADELRQQVEAHTADLNRSNRELLHFARAASHDLKEPVRKIRTFGTILIDEFEQEMPARAVSFIKKIIKSADRLRRMLESVKKYISLEKPVDDLQEVDLNTVINNVLLSLEVLIESRDARFTIMPLPVIEGSVRMLHLMFQNLIENSVKFSHQNKSLSIYIGATQVVSNNRSMVEIEITDTGIGFASEYSQKIFDSFVRLNSIDEYEGIGLGLSIVKQVVERHLGTISATGKEGEGASFRILLPLKQ